MDPGRNPKDTKIFLHQYFANCKGFLIVSDKGLTVLRENISKNKNVLLASLSYVSLGKVNTEQL